jgi:hypothetical protein
MVQDTIVGIIKKYFFAKIFFIFFQGMGQEWICVKKNLRKYRKSLDTKTEDKWICTNGIYHENCRSIRYLSFFLYSPYCEYIWDDFLNYFNCNINGPNLQILDNVCPTCIDTNKSMPRLFLDFSRLNGTLLEEPIKRTSHKKERKEKYRKRILLRVSRKLHCSQNELQTYNIKALKRMGNWEKFEQPLKQSKDWQKMEIKEGLNDHLLQK